MNGQNSNLPEDFRPIDGCVPEWIDIREICKDAQRYVGIYALTNVDAVAINNGRAIFTTSDRNGEFRQMFDRVVSQTYHNGVPTTTRRRRSSTIARSAASGSPPAPRP